MSGRRRLGLVAAAAGVVIVGAVLVRRAGVGSSPSARPRPDPTGATSSSTAAQPAFVPPFPTTPTPSPGPAPAALTPDGVARALEAIGKNEQTQRLFMRLQPVGLSREQRDRVLLILGTEALGPAPVSPTLKALRADGGSRVLSEEEARRVRDERQQIAERTLRKLRPALAAVLTPSQLAQAGLGAGDDRTATGERDRR